MFTGLVAEVGSILSVTRTAAGLEFAIMCGFKDLVAGESIAVNGACLTVREPTKGGFTCAAVRTTLEVTTIGEWRAGRKVNLERALRMDDRFGGHFVTGHVDAVARVTRTVVEGDAQLVDLAIPSSLSELMVERGSVAVDGVSLTIVGLPAPDTVQLSLIEFTRRHTTLGELRQGDAVHVEADLIAKHVRRSLEPHRE